MTEPTTDLVPLAHDDWAHRFFEAYLGHTDDPHTVGTITRSARHAGVHPNTVKRRLNDDLLFATLIDQANQELLEALEAEAYRRAKDGTTRPIYQAGEKVGEVQDIDNRHLEWLLERLNPEKWHLPTRIELTNPAGTQDGTAFTFHMGEHTLNAQEAPALEQPDEPENDPTNP